jgi:hypothetical protein
MVSHHFNRNAKYHLEIEYCTISTLAKERIWAKLRSLISIAVGRLKVNMMGYVLWGRNSAVQNPEGLI